MNEDLHDVEPDLPQACRAARKLLARFVGRGLPNVENQAFRQHLTHCEECRGIYRQTMTHAAAMGRAIREKRSENERERIRTEAHERVMNATGSPKRRNNYGLRLALLPAGIALLVLLSRASGRGSPFAASTASRCT